MKNKKQIEPAISKHFSELGKKGWQAKKKKILEASKVESNQKPIK